MKWSMSKSQDTNEHDLMEDLRMLRRYASKENKCSFFFPPGSMEQTFSDGEVALGIVLTAALGLCCLSVSIKSYLRTRLP